MSASPAPPPVRTGRRARRTLASVAAAAFAGLVLVACSGSNDPGGAKLGANGSTGSSPKAATASDQQSALAFAQCMRAHGIANFPDPGGDGKTFITSGSGIDPQSSQFQAAQQACRSLLPNGGQPNPSQQAQFQKAALAFSRCMRAHGIAGFPDPQFSGGGVSLQLPSGTDASSPQFQAAQSACQKLLPKPPGSSSTRGSGGASGGGPVTKGNSGSGSNSGFAVAP